MAARVIADSPALARVGLEDIWGQYNDEETTIWKDICPASFSTLQSFIEMQQDGDFGMAPAVDEANPIGDDDFFVGNDFKVTPFKRGLGFSIGSEAHESDMYGQFAKVVPKLKRAFAQTREQAGADQINYATSASGVHANPDGLALASTAHTYDGGTTSNLMTQAFGPTALENMAQNLMNQISHRGLPASEMGPYDLMLNISQAFLAERTLFSEGQANTANNDVNRIGKRMRKLITSPYFTNTTFFALNSANTKRQPLCVCERRGIRVKYKEDIDIDVYKWRVTEMYCMFARGFRGLYYSTGAG